MIGTEPEPAVVAGIAQNEYQVHAALSQYSQTFLNKFPPDTHALKTSFYCQRREYKG